MLVSTRVGRGVSVDEAVARRPRLFSPPAPRGAPVAVLRRKQMRAGVYGPCVRSCSSTGNRVFPGKPSLAGACWAQTEFPSGCGAAPMDVSLSELWVFVMDREAWRAAIHGVTKSRTRLSDLL